MSSFGSPNKVVSLSQLNTASPRHGVNRINNTTVRIKMMPSFFAYTFGRCYASRPTQWHRHVGACLNEVFLNIYKEYLFGFETLVFTTSGILSMHKQLVTLQRERSTWNRVIWPLSYFYLPRTHSIVKSNIKYIYSFQINDVLLNFLLIND